MGLRKVLKDSLPHVGVLLFFFVIVLVYFYPTFNGKVLQQGDIMHFNGMAQEALEYGEPTGWTGSMFSGMPTYHITGYEPSVNFIKYVYDAIYSDVVGPVFFLLVTAYLLFLILGVPWWMAALGAVASAFSSYNIIIIVAGHVTKAWALAFVPLVLSGMALVFKKKYWLGTLIFSFGLALLIIANHLQITYYAAIFCFILFVGFVVHRIRKKEYKDLGIASGLLAAGVLLAVMSNATGLYTNYESGQESMRGKSELTPLDNASESPGDGLDKDYVFAWSYGKGETFTLMIPNVMGGASGGNLDKDSHLYKAYRAQGAQVGKEIQAPTYWGEKSFTSGPVYFGAIICFLFVLALFIVPKNYKWWLLGAAAFFIFLAWGRNLAWFNDWMYHYFPLYNKFRTVETALVIPAFIFPILAVMALKEWVSNTITRDKLSKALYWSAGITGGICFLLWAMPNLFFTFTSSYDALYGLPDWYYDALIEDRKDLLRADALRSLIFILLAAGLLFLYLKAKNPKKMLPLLAAGLLVLVLIDLWQVDKRYLNEKNFVNKNTYNSQIISKSQADQIILQDKDVSYRVLNLRNPFQDSRTSYFHKSIGGYHAAKLGRYQDLIDRRLSPEIEAIKTAFGTATSYEDIENAFANSPTLNMLNMRYIIFDDNQSPIFNPNAFGNAWFVDSYRFVDTPDQEMAALNSINPLREAVLDKRFEESVNNLRIVPDESAYIEMTAYYPNRLEYKSSSSQAGLAVFSEVYYKNGWKAFVDGQQVPIYRADWILRAIEIPAGEHEIIFVFDPDAVKVAGVITSISSGLLLLLLLGGLVFYVFKKRK